MVDASPSPMPAPRPLRRTERWLRLWNGLVFLAWAVVPFALAGAGWLRGWLQLGVLALAVLLLRRHVRRRNPALFGRRARIREGTKGWDLAWNALFWPLLAATTVAAALQARGRAPTLPAWTWPLGAALLGAGFALSAAAMAVNPFFEGVVRIQREEGHRTVEEGPYRWIRHPGYAGLALWALSGPLLLGSVSPPVTVSALATVTWIILRTALEDSVLRRELPGYGEYTRRVKRRLVPGLW
jgi:protein-S-isoprenylcysteine O-methyltransferase Ste14